MAQSRLIKTFQSIQELKQALSQHDKETLLDTLAYIIDTYLINDAPASAEPAGADVVSVASEPGDSRNVRSSNFRDLIIRLQKDYSFPELKYFSIEDNRVYFTADNKKIEIKPPAQTENKTENKVNLKAQEGERPDETYKRFSNLEIE